MQAGQLDRLITLQGKTSTQDDHGGVVEAWAKVADIWAQYLAGGGNERFASAQVYAETQGRFRIRWRSGVTPQHRIVFDGKEWDIIAVDEIGRRTGLELKVKARA